MVCNNERESVYLAFGDNKKREIKEKIARPEAKEDYQRVILNDTFIQTKRTSYF